MAAAKKTFVAPRVTNRSWTLVSGLVVIPVGLTGMFKDKTRVKGHELCPDHRMPFARRDRVCEYTDENDKVKKHVPKDPPVKGYEYEPGKYAILEPDEIAALPVDHDGVIELKSCVDPEDVDSAIQEGAYFAFPTEDRTLEAYATLVHFLETRGKVLIGTGTWYGSMRSFTIRPYKGALAVGVCNYASNFQADVLKTIQKIKLPEISKQQVELADSFFGRLPDQMDWSGVTDTIAARQRQVIEQKVNEGKVTIPKPVLSVDEVPDVFEAMKAEVQKQVAKTKAGKKEKVTA